MKRTLHDEMCELREALREFGKCLWDELVRSGRRLVKFGRAVRKGERDKYIGRSRQIERSQEEEKP